MTSALFQSLFDLEIAIEIRKALKRFIKLPILKVLAFSDYIFFLAKARNKAAKKFTFIKQIEFRLLNSFLILFSKNLYFSKKKVGKT